MRKWFIFTFMINTLLVFASFLFLPEKVASHFSWGGVPDAWVSKESYALIFLALETPLFLILFYIPTGILKYPEKRINLPDKEYWLREENKPRVQAIFADRMSRFGTMFFAFLTAIQLLVMEANLSNPVRLKEILFLPVLAVFMLYVFRWVVGFKRAFRVPEGETSKPSSETGKS